MSFLQRAQAAIAHPSSESSRLEWLVRRAVYLARRGDDEALAGDLAALRETFSSSSYSAAIAAANFAEGVQAFCEMQFAISIDKLRRSVAMSTAIGARSLSRWAQSWKCHVLYSSASYAEAARVADEVLNAAEPTEHATMARVATTVAGALHFFADYGSARPWYELARRHALADEDDLTIDAILHGVAAFRLNKLRLSELTGELQDAEIRRAALELASSVNYDRMKSPASFRWMLPLQEIHLAMILGETDRARPMIESWLSSFSQEAPSRHSSTLTADLALCVAQSELRNDTELIIAKTIGGLAADAESDDLAVIFTQCSRAARMIGKTDQANDLAAKAREAGERFEAERKTYAPAFLSLNRPKAP